MSPTRALYALADEPGVDDGFAPAYAHESAGADLRTRQAVTLGSAARVVVATGVSLRLPRGTVGLICPKARLAEERGIILANGVAVLDSTYEGEVSVALRNTSPCPVTLSAGEAVAQLVVVPVCKPDFVPVTAPAPAR